MRIANYKKPKFMFLENVKHILKVSNGEVFNYIIDKIKKCGYILQIFQLSPHKYGIPQQRERVFFVCIRKDIYNGRDIVLIEKKYNKSINDIIRENDDKVVYKQMGNSVNVSNVFMVIKSTLNHYNLLYNTE